MSLAVLAKKSKHYVDRVSGCGHNGFSLNGGYRNQGWVGQDMLGRTLIGTKFRGVEPLGHGGSNGTYSTTVINTCRPCTNDPSIIKRSNMNTAGYISSRLTPRGQPCDETRSSRCAPIWVQKFDPDDHAQSEYIRHLRISATQCTWPDAERQKCRRIARRYGREAALLAGCTEEDVAYAHQGEDKPCSNSSGPYAATAGKNNCTVPCTAASYHIGGKKFYRTQFAKDLPRLAMSCGEYVVSRLMIVKSLPTPPCAAPWPPKMARDAQCKAALITPQDGYRAGILPEKWTNGGRTSMALVRWAEDAEAGDERDRKETREKAKSWAKERFSRRAPLPPPPPPQQAPRLHVTPVPVCKRRPQSTSNTWFYIPGTTPTVPVGGSCSRGIIRAKSRRAGGMLKAAPTYVFRKLT